ncbi:hypothetical protein ACWKSP_14955 [Micromonosporaceae bacterium Da 78-11]
MEDRLGGDGWYCVRTVYRFRPATYEERLTLWRAPDLAAAVTLAEVEADEYAADLSGCDYLGFAQAYEMAGSPGPGVEVFSLMRDSALPAEQYLDAFFDTGAERQSR